MRTSSEVFFRLSTSSQLNERERERNINKTKQNRQQSVSTLRVGSARLEIKMRGIYNSCYCLCSHCTSDRTGAEAAWAPLPLASRREKKIIINSERAWRGTQNSCPLLRAVSKQREGGDRERETERKIDGGGVSWNNNKNKFFFLILISVIPL